MHGGSFQTRGLPDVLAVYHGCAYGIEVKRPGKAATPIQQYVLDRMAEAGAVTGVAHSVEEALALLKE